MVNLAYLRTVLNHPVKAGGKWNAFLRLARWYVGSRLVPGPVLVPFIEGTRLLVHTGLREFEDMSFALHLARENDTFADVGANVGAYSVLLAGVRGCSVVAFEPGLSAFQRLTENIALNALQERIELRRVAVGDHAGSVEVIQALDTVNHVVAAETLGMQDETIACVTLDDAVDAGRISILKTDVGGYETHVLAGATRTLSDPALLGAIIETNESGRRFGSNDRAVDATMADYGFGRYTYDPFRRQLLDLATGARTPTRNTIYVRDADAVTARLQAAAAFNVHMLRV